MVLKPIYVYIINLFTAHFLKTCDFNDLQFTKCCTGSIQGLFVEMRKPNGIEGLEEVGSTDPLKIKRIKALSAPDGPVAINATLSNVTVTGFGDIKIVESK